MRRRELPERPYLHARIPRMTVVAEDQLPQITITRHCFCSCSPTRLAFGVLTFFEELVPALRPPGSATRVLSAGAQRRSAPKVPQGSAMVFLRISLAGKVPQGSAKVPRGSAKVPRKLRVAGCELRVASGFRKVPRVFLRILKDLPFGRFRRVPRRFREGSARFREVLRRFRLNGKNDTRAWTPNRTSIPIGT